MTSGNIALDPSSVPSTMIGMDSILDAFRPYGGALPSTPWDLGSMYAKTVVPFNYTYTSGITPDYTARTLDHGYGIQSFSNGAYTQTVPTSGIIGMGGFANKYQSLPANRLPVLVEAPTTVPGNQYVQHDIVMYFYKGAPQTFNFLNAKVIMITCWGAYGLCYLNNYTGGGFSQGVYVSPGGGSLYVYVGGAGSQSSVFGSVTGGWNGGGSGFQNPGNNGYSGAGGGATDVRTNYISDSPPATIFDRSGWYANDWGQLNPYWTQSATTTSLNSRIIVAGGGGAIRSGYGYGGTGGGSSGSVGTGVPAGGAGTQSNGGYTYYDSTWGPYGHYGGFGYGGGSYGYLGYYYDYYYGYVGYHSTLAGGGGGWYGGGAGIGGGGGSGYVGGMLPNTSTGSLNFGVETFTRRPEDAGYVLNPQNPNGYCYITILG